MDIPISLDLAGNIEQPTFVIEYRSGHRIGSLHDVNDLSFDNSMKNASVFTFSVDKINAPYYYAIKDFRLIWIPEWDKYYEIKVDISENQKKTKNVTLTHLPEAELSQIKLFGVEINTEADMDRDDYVDTTFYNKNDPKGSIINRVSEKAVNFTIVHIDESLAATTNKPEFSFDNISLYDAFQQIAEEYNCLFVFDSYTGENGEIMRTISVYDLEDSCENPECLHREENMGNVCPECGGMNIKRGYGEDTTIFYSLDNCADEIGYSTDVDSVKNCFHLESADEDMTAAIINANPNGSRYIWYISDELKEEMSEELSSRITEYDAEYQKYYKTFDYTINYPELDLSVINAMIEKYQESEIGKLITITNEDGTTDQKYDGYDAIIGYPELANLHYDVLDMIDYIDHVLMPSVDLQLDDTDAAKESAKLETYNWSSDGIAIQNLKTKLQSNPDYFNTSSAKLAVETAIKKKAQSLVDTRYTVDCIENSLYANGTSAGVWKGTFTLENKGDPDSDFYPGEDDTAIEVTIPISGDYEKFIKQCIDLTLAKNESEDYSTTGLFKKEYTDFVKELDKYGVTSLQSLQNICQSVIDILIEQGVTEEGILFDNKDLRTEIYIPYSNKLDAINNALDARQKEIELLENLEQQIIDIESDVHNILDFESYIKSGGNDNLWREFCSFRREDSYSNSNYSSEGLSNSEVFDRAKQFISAAQKEIIKSATLQHSINSSLKNLIAIKEFEPLLEHFAVGNWMRIEVNDQVYKLRMLSYTIDFGDYANINVEFSDVTKIGGYISDLQSIKDNVQSMTTSYSSVQRQTESSSKTSKMVNSWVDDGLSATTMKIVNDAENQSFVYDNHGVLIRQYDPLTNTYDPCQMKIVHSTIAITNDNWKGTKTAVGRFYYYNPVENEDGTHDLIEAYGVNGETIIGKLILGEQLGIYNEGNSLTFDVNGLTISNGTNTFVVNPNVPNLFTIKNDKTKTTILSLDNNGNLSITATITAASGKIGPWNISNTAIWKEASVFGAGTTGAMYFGNDGLSINNTFKVNSAGKLTATGADINGTITATNGKIGCWNITQTEVNNGVWGSGYGTGFGQKTGFSFSGTDMAFWAGDGKFRVNYNGNLYSEAANIKGDINATSITAKEKYSLYAGTIGSEQSRIVIKTDKWDSVNGYCILVGLPEQNVYTLYEDRSGRVSTWLYAKDHVDIGSETSDISLHGKETYFIGNVEMFLGLKVGENINVNKSIYFENNGYIYTKSTTSTDKVSLIGWSSSDNLWIGDYNRSILPSHLSLCQTKDKIRILNSSGTWSSIESALSDIRYKKDIGDIPNYKDFIMQLNPVRFKYNSGSDVHRFHCGFIANKLRKTMDQTIGDFAVIEYDNIDASDDPKPIDVNDESTFTYSMKYDELIAPHIALTQDHEKRINELENKIIFLQNIINKHGLSIDYK